MTPQERKAKVKELYEEHADYFATNKIDKPAYIPKMAYRPNGKDELHVTFFPSELENNMDIYTEFVSIQYDSEDPKRTLYLLKYNPHWKEEYELITSNSGFERHLIPVAELEVISDITTRTVDDLNSRHILSLEDLPNPGTRIINFLYSPLPNSGSSNFSISSALSFVKLNPEP